MGNVAADSGPHGGGGGRECWAEDKMCATAQSSSMAGFLPGHLWSCWVRCFPHRQEARERDWCVVRAHTQSFLVCNRTTRVRTMSSECMDVWMKEQIKQCPGTSHRN